jgi:Tfp pilus assembly protein PilO
MLAKALKKVRPTPALIHAFGAVTMAVTGSAFYFGFYEPASADMRTRSERMEQLEMLMSSSEKVAHDHRKLQDRLAELQTAANKSRKRMPRRHSTQGFIESITQLAVSHGLQVELCSSGAPEPFKTHTRVEVGCKLNGSYASVCRFLSDVDQLSQISRVSSFAIGSSENSATYPIQVTFQLYYRPELNDREQRRGTP